MRMHSHLRVADAHMSTRSRSAVFRLRYRPTDTEISAGRPQNVPALCKELGARESGRRDRAFSVLQTPIEFHEEGGTGEQRIDLMVVVVYQVLLPHGVLADPRAVAIVSTS